jgi:signal transduction histidine kinase
MDERSDEDLQPLPEDAATLRQRAEALASVEDAGAMMARAPEAIPHLLHELQVHQIELELQNEELRRIQEELEASHARYFDLYELAPVGYVTLSAKGLIQEANLRAAALLAVPRSALLHQPLAKFVAPGDQGIYYHHRRALLRADGSQTCELRMLRPKLAPFWARLEAMAVPGPSDEAATYRVVISDITARVKAEAAVRELNATLERRVDERTAALLAGEGQLRRTNAELERALRLKDEFLAMMSHELRTPLSVVLSTAEALTEELYGPIAVPQRQALGTLAQSGRHLLALLSDILDLSRISVGRESLELQSLDVRLICQIALQIVASSAQARCIELRHFIAPYIASVRADERRLTQILVNLLSNAVKFTPEGGAVGLEVVADADRQHLLLSVWDTGIGIAPADQERIFEPFIQADTRLTRQYGGVGLGLALVHRLTALHGGSVSLVSAIGQGSRFTVSLPWSAAKEAAPAAVDAPEAPPRI